MIQLLPYLLTGLSIAACYALTHQLNRALDVCRMFAAVVKGMREDREREIAEV